MLKRIIRFIKNAYKPRGASISFSQYGEDLIIFHTLIKKEKISYIDIGCHHPIIANNTYLLYRKGHEGIVVEPNQDIIELIKNKRPKDTILPIGIGPENSNISFYTFKNRSTRNTFDKKVAEEWQNKSGEKFIEKEVEIKRLDEIVKEDFDVLSIDAEGYDFSILKSYSWKIKPKIICVEKSDEIKNLLKEKGYDLFAENPSNAIFILCVE